MGAVLEMRPAGVCRFCGCTDARACEPGCFWIDLERTACSARACVDAFYGEYAPHVQMLLLLIRGGQ